MEHLSVLNAFILLNRLVVARLLNASMALLKGP